MSAAHATRSRAPAITDDQMQAAYEAMRAPGWPSLAELALQMQRWQLVHGQAIRLANGDRSAALHVPAPRTHAPSVALPMHPPILDRKRLASGERADD